MIIVQSAGSPPNTLFAVMRYMHSNVDAIEVDLRLTADRIIVLHDAADIQTSVTADHTSPLTPIKFLSCLELHRLGVCTLEQLLMVVGTKKPLILDIKEASVCRPLEKLLSKYSYLRPSIASADPETLAFFQRRFPQLPRILQIGSLSAGSHKIAGGGAVPHAYAIDALYNKVREIQRFKSTVGRRKVYVYNMASKKELRRFRINGFMTAYPERFGYLSNAKPMAFPVLPRLWVGEVEKGKYDVLKHGNVLNFVSFRSNENRHEYVMRNNSDDTVFLNKMLKPFEPELTKAKTEHINENKVVKKHAVPRNHAFGSRVVFVSDNKQGRKFISKYLKNTPINVRKMFRLYDNWSRS